MELSRISDLTQLSVVNIVHKVQSFKMIQFITKPDSENVHTVEGADKYVWLMVVT